MSAVSDHWIGAWAGSGAVSLMGERQNIESGYSVAGTLAVNSGDLVTKVKTQGANLTLGDKGSFKASSTSDGKLVSEGIALAISSVSGTGHSFDGDISVNLMNNTSATELGGLSVSGNALSWQQKAWAGDVQVTGGTAIGFTKGASAYAGGGTFALAKINNTVTSELKDATFKNGHLNDLSVEALSSMTQVTTAVSGQLALTGGAGGSSAVIAGAIAGVTVKNNVTANAENVTASLNENGTFDIVSESVSREEAKKQGIETGERQHFYSEEEVQADTEHRQAVNTVADKTTDNSGFIKDVELKKDSSTETAKNYSVKAGENQKVADLIKPGRLKQISVAVNAESAKNTGSGAVLVEKIDNTFKATGKSLKINEDADAKNASLRLKAESQASTVGVTTGIAVAQPSAEGRSLNIGGSVIVSNVGQTSEAGLSDSSARVSNISTEAKNDAVTVNVAGDVGVTLGSGLSLTGSAAVVVANTENTANAYVSGAKGNTEKSLGAKAAANAGKLSVAAVNNAQTWAAAVEGAAAAQSAAGGSVTVNRAFQHTDSLLSDSVLNHLTGVTVSSDDDSKLWTLAGGVAATWSGGTAFHAAVAYTQAGRKEDAQEKDTLYKKTGTRAAVKDVKLAENVTGDMSVTAATNDALHTLAVSAGVSAGVFGFAGSANVNSVYHATGVDISGLLSGKPGQGAKGTVGGAFKADATNDSSISGLSITGAGSLATAAVGLSTAVNRMATDTYMNMTGSSVVSGTSHASARSDLSTDMIGISGGGSATGGAAGFVAVNLIDDKTVLNVTSSDITTDGGNVVEAIGTSTIGSYAGGLSAEGTGGGNISVSVSKRTGDVTANVTGSTLYSDGTGAAVKRTAGIGDGDIVHDSFKQDIDLKDSLAGKFKTEDTKGVAVGAYSASTFKTFTVLAAGAGTFAGNGLGVGAVDSGKTEATVSGSTLYSGDANTHIKAGGYTNFYTVLAEGEGAGTFSLGLNGEWLSAARDVKAEVVKTGIEGYDVLLGAENKTGFSGVTAFAGGSGSVAGGAAAVIARNTGKAVSLMSSSTVNAEHDYLQDTYRLSNFRFLTVGAHGAANAAATGEGFVSYDDGDAMASLDSAGVDAKNDITVKSDRSTDVKTMLVEAEGAMYGAVGGILSLNTINTRSVTNVTHAGTTEDAWTLKAGNNVNILAGGKTKTELLEIDAKGSGQVGSGAIGVGVTETSDNSTSSVAIADAKIKAGNDTGIAASQDRFHDQKTVFVTASGGVVTADVTVSVMGLDINTAYDASKDPNAKTGLPGYRDMLSKTGAKIVESDKIAGTVTGSSLTDAEKQSVLAATSVDAGKRVLGKTSVDLSGATVEAKNISVKTAEDTAEGAGAKLLAAEGTAALSIGAAIDVNMVSVNQKRNMATAIDHSTLTAQNSLSVSNEAAGTYELKQWSVGASALAVTVQDSSNDISGTSSVTVANGSVLKAGELNVANTDRSSHSADSRSVTAGAVAIAPVSVSVTDKSLQRLTVSSSELDGLQTLLSVDRNHTLKTYVQPIVTVGLSLDGSSASSVDNAGSGDWISLSGSVFKATALTVNANDCADIRAEALHVEGNAGELLDAKAVAKADGTVGISATGNTVKTESTVITASAGLYDENDPDDSKTLRLSAKQSAYGSGVIIMGGSQTSTAESDVTVKNTFRNNTLSGNKDGTDQKLGVIAASDVRFTATGKSGSGSVLPLASYVAEANNNTKTVLDLGGLDSGDVTKVGDVYAGVSNLAEYTVDTNTFDIGVISALSPSKTRVKDYANAEANVSGKFSSGTDMTFFSSVETIGNLYAKTNGGAAGGYSGALIDTDIKGTSVLNVRDADLSADRLGLSAVTDTTLKPAHGDSPALDSKYYGGIIVGGGTLTNTVNRTSQINVTDSSLTGKRSVKIGAKDIADIKLNASTTTGSFVSVANSTVRDNLTFTNKIALSGDTIVKTTGEDSEVTIAAWSEENVEAKSNATGEGLFAKATADTVMNLTRTNDVTVGNGALVYSEGDVEIRAGRGLSGDASSSYKVSAEAVTKGIPLGTPMTLSGTASLTDKVTVENGANVRSVADTEIYAGMGSFSIKQQAKYTYEDNNPQSEDRTPVTVQKESKDRVAFFEDAGIKVDGSVIAGTKNGSKITVSGLVDADAGKDYTITDSHGTVLDVITKPVVETEGVEAETVLTGTESVANYYWSRHLELQNLITQYQGKGTDESRAMVIAYMQEDAFLLNEMLSRGLAEKQADGTYVVVDKVRRGIVGLSGITVSGGDISLESKKVTGGATGEIRAQGGEGINILNKSNMALAVSDMTILKDGGHLTVNGEDFRSAAAQKTMAGFSGTASGPGGSADTNSINIEASYAGDRNVVITGGGKSHSTIVDNAVFVAGKLENRAHDINISSRDSVTVDEHAKLLAAGSVRVNAQGSIVQRYSPGLTNIGGNANAPETMYANSISSFLATASKTETGDKWTYSTDAKDPSYRADYSAGVVAGGDIYFAGQMINVNGLIQSGYADYSVDVTDAASEKRIAEIKKGWQDAGSPTITTVKTDTYLVKKGGAYFTDGNVYAYRPDVWYDPAKEQLIVDDVKATGGSVYLTGAVSSTGAGRIYSADGALGLTVSAGNHNLALGEVDTGADRVGLVRITDTNFMSSQWDAKVTDYTGGKTTSYMTKVTSDGIVEGEKTITEGYTPYNPKAGLVYGWTVGKSVGKETTKTADQDFTVWGLFDWGDEKIGWTSVEKAFDLKELDKGATVAIVNVPASGEFVGQVDKWDRSSVTVKTLTKSYDNWTHFSGTYHAKEVTTEASTNLYSMMAKADKPVTVGMLKGSGNVTVSSAASVLLTENVTAKDGTVKMTAGKSILSEGDHIAIRDAKEVSLSAAAGSIGTDQRAIRITGEQGASSVAAWTETAASAADIKEMSDAVKSEYDALASSKVLTLDASAGTGAYIDASGWHNRIDAGDITAGEDAMLLADGDVKVGSIHGKNITVSSDKGGVYIGNVDQKTNTDLTQQMNGTARYRYTVAGASDNLYLGQIAATSAYSEVSLTAKGELVNALPREAAEDFSAEEKIKTWKEIGLIGQNGENIGEQIWADREAMVRNSVTSEYETYRQLKDADKSKWSQTTKDTFAQLESRYGSASSAEEALANSAEYQNLLKSKGDFGWTQTELLFAVADTIINPGSSSSEALFLTTPNVTAGKVTLTAGKGSVGTEEKPVTAKFEDFGDDDKNEPLYKALAKADIGDIKWDKTNRTVTVTVHRPVTVASSEADAATELNADATGLPTSDVTIAYLSDNKLRVDRVSASNEARISAKKGMEGLGDDDAVSADKITLRAGEGDLTDVVVNAKTWVALSAGGDISAEATEGPLVLYSVAGGSDVLLKAIEIDSYTDPLDPEGVESDGIVKAEGKVVLDAANIGRKDGGLGALRVADETDLKIAKDSIESLYVTSKGTLTVGSEGEPPHELVISENKELSGTGVMSLKAENIETTSAIKTEKSATLATRGTVTVGGKLSSDEEITVNAGTVLTVNDDIAAKGDTNMKAAEIVFADRTPALSVSGNNVTVTATEKALDTGKTNLTAEKQLAVYAKNIAAGEGTLSSGGDMVIGNTDETVTDVPLSESVALSGTTVAAGGTATVAGQTISVHGTEISAKDAVFEATGDMSLGQTFADVTGTIGITAKKLTADGAELLAGGDMTVTVGGDTLLSDTTLRSGNDMTVTADGNIVSDAALIAWNNLSVSGRDLSLAGDMAGDQGQITVAGDNVTFNRDGDVLQYVFAEAGITVTATGVADIGNAVVWAGSPGTAADVTVSGKDVYAGKADVYASHDVVMTATGETGSDGDLLVDGALLEAENTVSLTGRSLITSKADIRGNEIDMDVTDEIFFVTSDVHAKEDLEIVTKNFGTTGSTIVSGGDITADVTEDIVLNEGEFKTETGRMTLKAGRDIVSDAGLSAGGDVTVTAGNSLTLKGDTVSTGGDVTLKAADIDLEQTDEMNITGKRVSIESDTELDLGSAVVEATDGNVLAHADGVTAKKGIIKADNGTVEIIARDASATGGRLGPVILEGTNVSAGDGVTITGKKLEATTSVIASDEINLDVTEFVFFDRSTVTAVKDLAVTAEDFGTTGSQVTSEGDITVDTKNSALFNGGMFSAGGDMTVTAGDTVASDADFTAGGDIAVTAGNLLVLQGNTESQTGGVTLKAADIDLEQTEKMSISGKSVTIESDTGLDLGSAFVYATDGDIYAHANGVTAKNGLLSAAKGSVNVIARDETAGGRLGDVVFEGTGVSAEKTVTVTGKTFEATDSVIASDEINLDVNEYVYFENSSVSAVKDLAVKSDSFATINSDVSSEGRIDVDVADSALLEGGAFEAGGDMTVKAGANIVSDAGLKAGGDITVEAAHLLVLQGDTVSENGNVKILADDIDLEQTDKMAIVGDAVEIASASNLDLGTARITARTGNVDIDSQDGITAGAGVIESLGGNVLIDANDNAQGTGDIVFNGLKISAAEDAFVNGDSLEANDTRISADRIGLVSVGDMALTGSSVLEASFVKLMSETGSVRQDQVAAGAGIQADAMEVSAEQGSVSLGALPAGGAGGNRVSDMTVKLKDELNIGAAVDKMTLDITQTDGDLQDVTIHNAGGSVDIRNYLSSQQDVLVYASGVSAGNIKAGNLLEIATLGLEDGAGNKGIATGDLSGTRVAVASGSGDIKTGDIEAAGRADVYRTSRYTPGRVSLGDVTGSSVKILNGLGTIEAGRLLFTDKNNSAIVRNRMYPSLAGYGSGIRDLPVDFVIVGNPLQTAMLGLSVPDAASIKGPHIDLISLERLASPADQFLPQVSVYRSYDLNSPAGYYFGLDVREDISVDSVDGLPVIHEHLLTEDGVDLTTDVLTLSLNDKEEIELGYQTR